MVVVVVERRVVVRFLKHAPKERRARKKKCERGRAGGVRRRRAAADKQKKERGRGRAVRERETFLNLGALGMLFFGQAREGFRCAC